jgi:hypothetical protein
MTLKRDLAGKVTKIKVRSPGASLVSRDPEEQSGQDGHASKLHSGHDRNKGHQGQGKDKPSIFAT